MLNYAYADAKGLGQQHVLVPSINRLNQNEAATFFQFCRFGSSLGIPFISFFIIYYVVFNV
jgi:hypothetical protein